MKYQRIRDIREDWDLKQSEIAESIGLYTTTYQRYERGEREVPLDIAIALAKHYNVSLDYLAGLTDIPRTLDGKPYQVTGKNVVTFNAPIKGNVDIH
ncbi:MAG: helix-turn-helix transcriptional regulator [Clostridia bacterium]|nr:helix-turn-helix transcriptional regulator [Clostridia bacterium]